MHTWIFWRNRKRVGSIDSPHMLSQEQVDFQAKQLRADKVEYLPPKKGRVRK